MVAIMTDIPQTTEEFEAWYARHYDKWPDDLDDKAYRVLLTLKSMRGKSFGKSDGGRLLLRHIPMQSPAKRPAQHLRTMPRSKSLP